MSDDTLRKAWRDIKAGLDPGDVGRAALREHERRLAEETARPRITNGAFQKAEKHAKRHGISTGALIDQLIQRHVAGELIDAHEHRAALRDREKKLLELEREIDRLETRRETDREEARQARAETATALEVWLNALDHAIRELDFVDAPEPDDQDFLGPTGKTTTGGGVQGAAG